MGRSRDRRDQRRPDDDVEGSVEVELVPAAPTTLSKPLPTSARANRDVEAAALVRVPTVMSKLLRSCAFRPLCEPKNRK